MTRDNLGTAPMVALRGVSLPPATAPLISSAAQAELVNLTVHAGECAALVGEDPRTPLVLLRMIVGEVRPFAGRVLIRHDGAVVDMARADASQILDIRRRTIGLFSRGSGDRERQTVHDAVLDAARWGGASPAASRFRASELLRRLDVGPRWWGRPLGTCDDSVSTRVRLAKLFATGFPILLLDRPCEGLPAPVRDAAALLIDEALDRGATVLAAFSQAGLSERFAGVVHRMPAFAGEPRPAA